MTWRSPQFPHPRARPGLSAGRRSLRAAARRRRRSDPAAGQPDARASSAPDFVLGVMNHRGAMLPVIDQRSRLDCDRGRAIRLGRECSSRSSTPCRWASSWTASRQIMGPPGGPRAGDARRHRRGSAALRPHRDARDGRQDDPADRATGAPEPRRARDDSPHSGRAAGTLRARDSRPRRRQLRPRSPRVRRALSRSRRLRGRPMPATATRRWRSCRKLRPATSSRSTSTCRRWTAWPAWTASCSSTPCPVVMVSSLTEGAPTSRSRRWSSGRSISCRSPAARSR